MTTPAELQRDGAAFVEVNLDLHGVIELNDLVKALAGISSRFRAHLAAAHPELAADAKIVVRDLRKGSIIIELAPLFWQLYQSADMAVTIDNFVNRLADVFGKFRAGHKLPDATPSELTDYLDTVTLLAKDDGGSMALASTEYHATKTTKRVSFQFTDKDAQKSRETIERQKLELTLPAHEVVENALMVFWGTNKKKPQTGKRTGEKAVIEHITQRALAVTYETDTARERIKFETTQGERNAYKLGFYVDCYVERLNGKPVAYRITSARDIIELPDDDQPA